MKNSLIIFTLVFISSSCTKSTPEKVFEKNNNIFVQYTNGNISQLTHTKMDKAPVLSPDKNLIAFIRKTNGAEMESGSGPGENNEIWLFNLALDKGKAIVHGKEGDSPETILINLQGLFFTSDSRYIYFMSDAWATSAAVHRYDISTGKEKFISDANDLIVIPTGKYKDDLIVNKHKYYHSEDGGSYDPYCLLNAEGKELKEIGEEENAISKFLEQNK
ncbi:MAG: hypothetical protein JWN78_1203 [Bacteroidota bacterium]|nr:hypothetical protein [Bacteroidota bacterium]